MSINICTDAVDEDDDEGREVDRGKIGDWEVDDDTENAELEVDCSSGGC